ncbi:MAG TPA: hypothetical protein VF461_15630 [Gemmatimonadaceae bacterium]
MKATVMKSTMMAVVVPAMLLVPTVLRAQGGGVAAQGQTQSQAQVQAQTPQARIDAALSAAAKANVPVELVKSKIAEGEAKRVPPDRIASAVEKRVTSLTRASETMKHAGVQAGSAGELAVTADALDAGVSESAVVRVTRETPAERRTVAIAVLADLVRLGNASDRALARVSNAVTSTAALANLRAEVASQLTAGGLGSTLDAVGAIRVP